MTHGRCRSLATLPRASSGATIVEFALVLLPFMALIMGGLDLGYQCYLNALTIGTLERVARVVTVGNVDKDHKEDVAGTMRDELRTILPLGSRDDPDAVTVTALSYTNFAAVGKGERIVSDTVPIGEYNSTDCYEDRNNNGRYDATFGGGDNLGSADDVIYYEATVKVPRLFPLATMIKLSPFATVNVRMLVRNQPFGTQQINVRCS